MTSAAPSDVDVYQLPRGGTIVRTSAGLVQFGAPPETIKDALGLGLAVPKIYVLPSSWFSRRRGLTLAELEFPAYYNYFLHGRRLVAVCDEDGRRRLHTVLRESLLGPESYDQVARDFDVSVPPEARPNLAAECEFFRAGAGGPDGVQIDDMVDCRLYDAAGRADLGDGVVVERTTDADGEPIWRLVDHGRTLAEVADVEPPVPAPAHVSRIAPRSPFAPPAFGVTVLGSSHGFDPGGKTTGFVLWINKRGVLVDPPCDATDILRGAGMPPRQVDAVVLTHCHADHDSGVFQKVLEEGRVNLYTTPTILASFLRKWVAITGETEERLRRLFVFRPVTIGAPLRINGGEFRFMYSLHSIPTIGFECWFGGKSLCYSSDTLYQPERIDSMHNAGVMTAARRAALLDFPWHHALVIHEAGVPPIHTPAAQLAALPPAVKQRLRLIHIAESDLPAGQGLSLARTGFENTIDLPVAEPRHAEALEALDALASIELFRTFNVARCREFLTIARRETHAPSALIIGQGEPGDRFYIIVSGEAVVVKDGVIVKTYRAGDFFGETALVTGAPRSADVRAKTELVLLAVDKYDFLSFLRGTDLVAALVRLARNRDLRSWDVMGENPVLRVLTAAQRTQLQAVLEHAHLDAGHDLWIPGQNPEAAYLLDTASAEFTDGDAVVALGHGALLGDFDAMVKPRPYSSRATILQSGDVYRVPASDLKRFLENNPGVQLALAGSQFVD
jgi:CRP-like cAMP-binding protein/phosphoribosyl 1,2-cyclic phosphodiesterase